MVEYSHLRSHFISIFITAKLAKLNLRAREEQLSVQINTLLMTKHVEDGVLGSAERTRM